VGTLQRLQLSNKACEANFWENNQITPQQFIEQADTFDILLFQCSTPAAGLIRTYSQSIWDHVGMCVKFDSEPNEIFILEATGNQGVHFKRFSNTIKHLNGFYSKLALRQLDF